MTSKRPNRKINFYNKKSKSFYQLATTPKVKFKDLEKSKLKGIGFNVKDKHREEFCFFLDLSYPKNKKDSLKYENSFYITSFNLPKGAGCLLQILTGGLINFLMPSLSKKHCYGYYINPLFLSKEIKMPSNELIIPLYLGKFDEVKNEIEACPHTKGYQLHYLKNIKRGYIKNHLQ